MYHAKTATGGRSGECTTLKPPLDGGSGECTTLPPKMAISCRVCIVAAGDVAAAAGAGAGAAGGGGSAYTLLMYILSFWY